MAADEVPAAGAAARPSVPAGRTTGLLEKLVAAVRPEFRAGTLVIDPDDTVFGGPPCRVGACERAARLHGLCDGHYQRWERHGRPDIAGFAESTSAAMRTRAPLQPCLAPGCGHGRNSNGLCVGHMRAWQRSGHAEIEAWLQALPPAVTAAPHGLCRVTSCSLWATAKTPLCTSHAAQWRKRGRPDVGEFTADYAGKPLTRDYITVRTLEPQLRLEVQYVLQQRHDDREARIQPALAQRAIYALARSGMTSLLQWPDDIWRERVLTGPQADRTVRPFLRYARAQVDQLCYGAGWEVEYPRDVWRLRNLGVESPQASLRFDRITQPWLKDLAKRWTRWRISSGISGSHVGTGVSAITRFAEFLARRQVSVRRLSQIDRAVLERYLAELSPLGETEHRGRLIGLLSTFLQDVRRHRWDTSLPTDAIIFPEDFPRQPKPLPRALAEHVMAQVEHPGNLDRWSDPAYRLITMILIRCGLRVSDATKLAFDCIVRDRDDAPYLRYYNHKMKREALVPVDEQLDADIGHQQQRVRDRYPDGTPVLFPRPMKNLTGGKPLSGGTYRQALHPWLERCDVRDEHGQLVHLTPHQWRHTLGHRLINRDVPQEVVRKILDHDSPEMTARYARLHDATVRRHWEAARKVNISGEAVTLDPEGPLAEAAWAKQRVGRATQALPNGYCGLPVQQSCPHANACLTCPVFITTAEHLPQHRAQHQQTLQIITAAEALGQTRLAEMNRQVAGNLEKIITALESGDDPQESTASAS